MNIHYPSHVRWFKNVANDPLESYSKSNQARLRSTLNKISESTVYCTFEPLTQELIDWFTPLYIKTISTKNSPNLFDIAQTTIQANPDREYVMQCLYENGKRIGATVVSVRDDFLGIVYRIYPNRWNYHKFQANPSLYSDYIVAQYAITRNKQRVSHGKDRNLYGENLSIGLANFKLSVGCSLSIKKDEANFSVNSLSSESVQSDTLVFHMPEEGECITKGTLFCTEESVEKYNQLLTYDKTVKISTLYYQSSNS